jgi:hypothetical protein
MRRVLAVAVTMIAGSVLLSCDARQPTAVQPSSPVAVGSEPLAPIARSPLSPPMGYATSGPANSLPTPLVPYSNSSSDEDESQEAQGGWVASPQWAAVQGKGCIEVEQDPRDDQAGVQSDTPKVRVQSCSNENADDFTVEQPEASGGY